MAAQTDTPFPAPWGLFDASSFLVRYGGWPDWAVSAWVLPAIGVVLLYAVAAAAEAVVCRRSRGGAFPRWSMLSLAAFFFGCSLGHLCGAAQFRSAGVGSLMPAGWYVLLAGAAGAVAAGRRLRAAGGEDDYGDGGERRVRIEAACDQTRDMLRGCRLASPPDFSDRPDDGSSDHPAQGGQA